ncbi:hypothetical protein [Methylocapsa sp. S129]|uniref:hypothetical protein n=1 Tax=Methylocapsa sp. S129 TaxID=1641869 RepID=UPI00131E1179|nr:hypothetical protein [Methylocapsa sp. S129]
MTRAIEITSFMPRDGLGAADFVAANADVDPWLRRQPGFVERIMVEERNGRMIDMVIWESRTEAEDSARRLMSELADSPVHDVIEQASVSWAIRSIVHQS